MPRSEPVVVSSGCSAETGRGPTGCSIFSTRRRCMYRVPSPQSPLPERDDHTRGASCLVEHTESIIPRYILVMVKVNGKRSTIDSVGLWTVGISAHTYVRSSVLCSKGRWLIIGIYTYLISTFEGAYGKLQSADTELWLLLTICSWNYKSTHNQFRIVMKDSIACSYVRLNLYIQGRNVFILLIVKVMMSKKYHSLKLWIWIGTTSFMPGFVSVPVSCLRLEWRNFSFVRTSYIQWIFIDIHTYLDYGLNIWIRHEDEAHQLFIIHSEDEFTHAADNTLFTNFDKVIQNTV